MEPCSPEQNNAIKLAHELNDVDESSTGDKTSYAKEEAGDASTNREAEEKNNAKAGEGQDEGKEEESSKESKESKDEGESKEQDSGKDAQVEGGKVRRDTAISLSRRTR